MHQTYELFFEDSDGSTRFEALTCIEGQLVTRVQARLSEAGARAVEVWQFGRRIFTLRG